jgi:hypothetical protein
MRATCRRGAASIGARPARGSCGRRKDGRVRRRPDSSHDEESLAGTSPCMLLTSHDGLDLAAWAAKPLAPVPAGMLQAAASSKCTPHTPHCRCLADVEKKLSMAGMRKKSSSTDAVQLPHASLLPPAL